MDEFITTCVQQQIRVFESHGEFRSDIQRFMRLAKIKESHLVIFPELCGLLLAPPLVPGLKRTLLRVAERQVKRKPSLIDRMVGRIANSATDALGGIGGHIMETFAGRIDTLRDAYLTIFSETAREYEMYILAGSIYLPDARDGQMHNTAHLFGPTGEVIGQQSKITLDFADTLFCKPATTGLEVFDTDFGKLGILIGQDVLFPESGRILGALGAAAVAHLVAAPGPGVFSKLRNALAARLQENVLLGAQSCLVGKNIVASPKNEKNDYVGKSAILAPAEMTTRHSGLLGEVGSMVTDGVISTVWDIKRLYELRSTIDVPTHEPLRNEVLRRQIQALYGIIAEAPALPVPTAGYAPILGERPQAEPEAAAPVEIPSGGGRGQGERSGAEPEAAAAEAAPTAEPREGEPEAEIAAPAANLDAYTGPASTPEPAPAPEMAAVEVGDLPPLPLVYVAEPVAPTATPVDETPAAPAVELGEDAVEEIVPLQLRVPESLDDEEPAPAEAHRDDAGLWPALEELAAPAAEAAAPETRLLLVSPTDETGSEEPPPAAELAEDPETGESAPPTETGASEEDEPQAPRKKRWPFLRR